MPPHGDALALWERTGDDPGSPRMPSVRSQTLRDETHCALLHTASRVRDQFCDTSLWCLEKVCSGLRWSEVPRPTNTPRTDSVVAHHSIRTSENTVRSRS